MNTPAGVMKIFCRNGSGINEKNVSWYRSGIVETNVADMEVGVMKICCWNGSRSDEKNVAEMEAGNSM